MRILGKYDWMKRVGSKTGPNGLASEFTFPPVPIEAASIIGSLPQPIAIEQMVHLFAMSKAIAGGLKIVAPSFEQCEAMAHTDAHVPFVDFKPPYPSMVFSWPTGWKPFDHRFEVTWLQEVDGATVLISQDSRKQLVANILAHNRWPTIEDTIQNSLEIGSDIEASKVCERVAVNLCLLMTIHRWTQRPIDRPGERKAKKLMRSRKRRVKEAGQRMLESLPQQSLLSFDQNIKLFERVEYDERDGKGKPKRPHWRRGHFRPQAHGPGWSQRRTIYIPPVMVNRGKFRGDEADTTVTYQV
jgi:hypothetical protein